MTVFGLYIERTEFRIRTVHDDRRPADHSRWFVEGALDIGSGGTVICHAMRGRLVFSERP